MKRLLLITYVFPPEPSPGALRPSYLARYLPEFGWDVTVLTHSAGTPPFEADVERAGDVCEWFARLPYRVQDAVLVPDTTMRWVPQAIARGHDVLRRDRYDAILSTALPASAHVAACALARERGLPWLADYRDPWSGSLYVRRIFPRAALERALETKLLTAAREITTVSEPIAEQLRALHSGKVVSVIPNAPDPREWNAVRAEPPAGFDLVYTGSMYDGKRSPDVLFEALAHLRAQNDSAAREVRIHFYGPNSGTVMPAAHRYGVEAAVRVHGTVPRSDAMHRQRSAAALLVFLNMDSRTSEELGSKILEYAGSRRPILAFGPRKSVVRSFIEEHRLGWFASDTEEAASALSAAYAYFKAGSPDLAAAANLPTARDMAARFAERLDAIVPRFSPALAREAS